MKKAQISVQDFHYREALHDYQKAWDIYKTDDNPQIQTAILYNIGHVYYNLQEYENALKYYKLSIQSFSSLEKETRINILNNVGVIYRYLGRYDDALEYFDTALKIIEALGTDQADDSAKAALMIHLNKAVTLIKAGDMQQALALLDSLLIAGKNEKYQYEMALTQAVMGIVEASYVNNVRKAQEYAQQALLVFEGLHQKYDIAFSYHNIGRLYAEQKNYPEALRYYTQSLKLAEETGDQEMIWLTHYSLGNAYRDQADCTEALHHYRESIRVIETIRSTLKIDDLKTSFIEDKIRVYHALIKLLLEFGQEKEAFHYLERAKSRALIDLLGNQKIDVRENVGPELMTDTEQSDERIRRLLKQLEQEYSKPQEQRGKVIRLTGELRKERQHYQELLHDIQAQNLEYASFLSVTPLQLEEIQHLIPEHTAFLEYAVLDEKTFVFIVTRKGLQVETVDVSQKSLQGTVLAFRIEIEREISGWQEKSHWLYSKLIQPAEKHLQGIESLCIIPYGALHYLPFGALLTDDTENARLLLEQYDLFYAPSSTVLKFAFDKGNTHPLAFAERYESQNFFLMCANPDGTLAYAEEEAKGIQQLYPHTKLLVESEATKDTVKSLIDDYRLIHFATHSFLDPVQPLFSSLVLADELLEVHEIFNEITLAHSSLVTLSACNTALGHGTKGDEIIGLSRAFLYAGAPSIVASLWAVDDRSTALLMQRFYEYLAGAHKVNALKQAQISLFYDTEYPVFHHPYYWAAFTLIGDYR